MPRGRATTRADIDTIALDMFLEHGFDTVTSSDLAAACGISRPTLFRYAPQMSAIVLEHVNAFAELTVGGLREQTGPAWASLSATIVAPYRSLDDESPMGKAFAILAAEPGLRGQSGLMVRDWRSGLAGVLRERGLDDVRAEAYAGAAIGIVTAAFAHGWPADTLAEALMACTPAEP